MATKTIEGATAADFLHAHGLIFEINRKVLHPFGLALGFEADEETGAAVGPLKLFDFGEPTTYADNPERDRAREAALQAFKASRAPLCGCGHARCEHFRGMRRNGCRACGCSGYAP